VKLSADHGKRADRNRARIKYLVHDWGVERFREVLATYLPSPVGTAEAGGGDRTSTCTTAGTRQGDGRWFYGLSVENVAFKTRGAMRLRSGLRAIVQRLRPEAAHHIAAGHPPGQPPRRGPAGVWRRCWTSTAIVRPERLSQVRRYSMACPGHPDVRPGHLRE